MSSLLACALRAARARSKSATSSARSALTSHAESANMQLIIDPYRLSLLKSLTKQLEDVKLDHDTVDNNKTLYNKLEAIEGCIAQFNETVGKCIKDIHKETFGED
jgi:hypothetical protein